MTKIYKDGERPRSPETFLHYEKHLNVYREIKRRFNQLGPELSQGLTSNATNNIRVVAKQLNDLADTVERERD